MVIVNVKRLHPDAVIPQYAHEGDAGFDLVAVEDTWIHPQHTVRVSTGLAFEIPPGYEMQIRPRSGISYTTSLRIPNSPGTVDSGYRGEVKVLFTRGDDAPFDEPYCIKKGTRIAQGVIKRVPDVTFVEVNELNVSERGTGGFGSSGELTHWVRLEQKAKKLVYKLNEEARERMVEQKIRELEKQLAESLVKKESE